MPAGDELLEKPLRFLRRVGPRRAADLARIGLYTVEDLLSRFPFRYEDRGQFLPIASLRPGQTASIAGEIVRCGVRLTRRPNFRIFHALAFYLLD